MRRHLPRTVAVLATSALLLSGCSAPWFQDATDQFIAAFNESDDAGAAALTAEPEQTAAELAELREGLGETRVQLEEGASEDGTSEITATWTVPGGDTVETSGELSRNGADSDLVDWDMQVLDLRLDEDSQVQYSDDRDVTVPLTDIKGTDVLAWTTVHLVSAGPELLPRAAEIAEAVRPVLPEATPESVSAQLEGAEGEPTVLYALREEDFTQVRGALAAIDGLTFSEQGRMLGPSRATASPLDQGLRDYWLERIDADAGWTLRASTGTEDLILGQEKPRPTEPIRTTLDLGVQTAANRALAAEERPAAIVAISASTGGVVAVAQNDAANELGAIALTGLYPPGSTFKTVTTAAALQRGTVQADSMVDCPATAEIDGRVIPNDSNFELGEVTMSEAFAQSCNTTQGFISQGLEPGDMKDMAASMGLGVDFAAPGMTTVTGSVPVTEPGAARVEAAIGQGEVLASPFGLAVMEATLGNGGRLIPPMIIQGEETTADQSPAPVDPAVVDSIRKMMAATVSSGTAGSLSGIDHLGGKTGTAEVGNGPAHGWFTGLKGDLAFATFVAGADSSGPALEATGRFLEDPAMSEWR